jgi:enterochelin esterase-like enzyme
MKRSAILALAAVVLALAAPSWADGVCETRTIDSALLGEERTVSVYLPEGYVHVGEGLPVIYWHSQGFTCWPELLEPTVEAMIGNGLIDPAIFVFFETHGAPFPDDPDVGSDTTWSFMLNSRAMGPFRDYVVDELIPWVDWNYNTVPAASHRFITGHSGNAYGPWRLALERPDLFSKVSGMQGLYEWTLYWNFCHVVKLEAMASGESPPYQYAVSNGFYTFMMHSGSAVLLQHDHGPPWYDFPLDGDGQPIDELWERMFDQDIGAIVDSMPESARDLDLYFGVGLDDRQVPGHSENLAAALDARGIPYVFHTYPGGHGGDDFVLERIPVHITHFLPIKATAEVSPRIADPRLHPPVLRMAVELPDGLDVADIDCSTITLVGIDGNRLDSPIGCSTSCEVSDVNGNGTNDLSVWLPCGRVARAALAGGAEAGDIIELRFRGELSDDRFFQATDSVKLGLELQTAVDE